MKPQEIITIVDELNSELYDRTRETEHSFCYTTNGFVDLIQFDRHTLWCSENDDRYINDTDEQEPLADHVKRMFNEWVARLVNMKFSQFPQNCDHGVDLETSCPECVTAISAEIKAAFRKPTGK